MPPKPDRSKGGGLTKSDPLALQVWGLGTGLTTQSRKKVFITETAAKETITTGCEGPPESSGDTRINVSRGSRKEDADRITKVLSAKCKTKIGFWRLLEVPFFQTKTYTS